MLLLTSPGAGANCRRAWHLQAGYVSRVLVNRVEACQATSRYNCIQEIKQSSRVETSRLLLGSF